MPEIPSVVKYLIDHYKIKFFLSGSASFYIKNMFTESLTGRKYIFELYPFSFDEFLKTKDIKQPDKQSEISEAIYLPLAKLFSEYQKYGAFPAVVLEDDIQKKKINSMISFHHIGRLRLKD